MTNENKPGGFWSSLPGVLGGIAAIIGAVVAAILAFRSTERTAATPPAPEIKAGTPVHQMVPPPPQHEWGPGEKPPPIRRTPDGGVIVPPPPARPKQTP